MTQLPSRWVASGGEVAKDWGWFWQTSDSLFIPGWDEEKFAYDYIRRDLQEIFGIAAGHEMLDTQWGRAMSYNRNSTTDNNGILLTGENALLSSASDVTLFWVGRFHGTAGSRNDSIFTDWSTNGHILLRYDPTSQQVEDFIYTTAQQTGPQPSYSLSDGAVHSMAWRFSPGRIDIWLDGNRFSKTSGIGTSLRSAAASNVPQWHRSDWRPADCGRFDQLLGSVHVAPVSDAQIERWVMDPFGALRQPDFVPLFAEAGPPPVGAIMNQLQRNNVGADLFNGALQ